MNFDFSDEQKQMRDEARKFLTEKCPPKAVREVLDGKAPYDKELWKGLAEMGFLGVAIPEQFGGAGAGHLELCVIAEEMGRALAPVPFSSTVYLAAEAIMLAGSEAQKRSGCRRLPRATQSARWHCSKAMAASNAEGDQVGDRFGQYDRRRESRRSPTAKSPTSRSLLPRARHRAIARATSGCSSSSLTGKGRRPARAMQNLDPTRQQAEITFKGGGGRTARQARPAKAGAS